MRDKDSISTNTNNIFINSWNYNRIYPLFDSHVAEDKFIGGLTFPKYFYIHTFQLQLLKQCKGQLNRKNVTFLFITKQLCTTVTTYLLNVMAKLF